MSWTIDLMPRQPASFLLTSDLAEQPVVEAVEIAHCDVLDLELVVVTMPSLPTLTFTLSTGMQRETTDGWVDGEVSSDAYDFPVVSIGTKRVVKRFSAGLLRFARWRLRSASLIVNETVVFYVRGLGRSFRGQVP